jgi:ABC-type multidrug transport system fused ATPase/permease subunit
VDLIVVLDRGRVVESGRHDVLVACNGYYACLWRSQARREAHPHVYGVPSVA